MAIWQVGVWFVTSDEVCRQTNREMTTPYLTPCSKPAGKSAKWPRCSSDHRGRW